MNTKKYEKLAKINKYKKNYENKFGFCSEENLKKIYSPDDFINQKNTYTETNLEDFDLI